MLDVSIWAVAKMPRIMWPLMMYEFPLKYVEELEGYVSKHLRRWLCVPPCPRRVYGRQMQNGGGP